MPYRIDVSCPGADAFDRLVEIGALDVELAPDGAIAALLPDGITPAEIARSLGVGAVGASPAVGRDAGSVWVLRPRPIRIGGVQIVPASSDAPSGAVQLIDDVAFGTGLHPTTALCLEAIEELVQAGVPAALLDVGTGSGVLALAALRMGVPRALGLDVDHEALRVAAENARLNALDGRLELRRGAPAAVSGVWPLIVANVLAAPLMEMAPALVQRVGPGGQAVLSGIPSSIAADVDRVYSQLGMRRVLIRSRAGWVALVLRASW